MQQINEEPWAQPDGTAAKTESAAATQWTQEQWDASQLQAAQEQAAFDVMQAHQAQLAAAAAQQQIEAHAEAVPQHPAFDPSQWAPPNPDEQAA